MALIKCPECGHDVSDKAKACPNCGFPMSIEEKKVSNNIEEMDSVYLGRYPQSVVKDTSLIDLLDDKSKKIESGYFMCNGKKYFKLKKKYYEYEPIRWRVLEKKGNSALLITDKFLAKRMFSSTIFVDEGGYIFDVDDCSNWDTSDLRKWLNKDFFDNAFNAVEQDVIETRELDNSLKSTGLEEINNKYIRFESTKDKLFILSFLEAKTLFKNDSDRKAEPTDFSDPFHINPTSTSQWLRSPANWFYNVPPVNHKIHKRIVQLIRYDGKLFHAFAEVENNEFIRIACYVNINMFKKINM